MEKPIRITRYEEAADALDSSYVELQEHDFLVSEEFSCDILQNEE